MSWLGEEAGVEIMHIILLGHQSPLQGPSWTPKEHAFLRSQQRDRGIVGAGILNWRLSEEVGMFAYFPSLEGSRPSPACAQPHPQLLVNICDLGSCSPAASH